MTTDPITTTLRSFVDEQEIAGAATLVWRDGAVIQHSTIGWRDVEAELPVERDTLFRIASMTKPITSVVALMLLEEGRFALDDPITRWVPELANLQVLRAPDGPLDDTVPAARPLTFEDLLTHRAGFTYGDFHTGPIAKAYADALGGDIDTALTPEAWIKQLAMLPLIDQPGHAFHYGRSTDLLGLIMARIEDASLSQVMQRRIFDPLEMKDTHFTVPRQQRHRRAAACGFDDAGRLVTLPAVPGGAALAERPDGMTYESGGQGLWSTLDDYLAFARLFVGQGSVDGVRLLRPETLELMTANRLTDAQRASSQMLGMPLFAAGHGFGMGVAVVTEPDQATSTPCGGGMGAVGWPSAYGGWWRADPSNNTVLIFLTHHMPRLDQLANGIGFGVYAAIEAFQEIARNL